MKKLALIAGLVLMSQAAFAVVVAAPNTACVTANAVQGNYVCTNGVWVARPAATAAAAAAIANGTASTVNNTVVRSPTVVAPGADAAARAAAVPGTAATRAAVRAPGNAATRNAARGRAAVRRPGR